MQHCTRIAKNDQIWLMIKASWSSKHLTVLKHNIINGLSPLKAVTLVSIWHLLQFTFNKKNFFAICCDIFLERILFQASKIYAYYMRTKSTFKKFTHSFVVFLFCLRLVRNQLFVLVWVRCTIFQIKRFSLK